MSQAAGSQNGQLLGMTSAGGDRGGDSRRPFLAVVIPCYNEEAIIRDTYRRLKDTCQAQNVDYEIIFGNDGSQDRTLEMLREIAAADQAVRITSHHPNRGAGFTYREMYEAAGAEVIIQMDADLAMPAEVAVPALLQALKEADVAVGSRYAGVKADYPLKRLIFSRGYQMLTHLLFRFDIMDTQTGCIGFYRRILPDMDLRSDGFEMLLEFIVQAHRQGLKVAEVGLPWYHDTTSGETEVFGESIKMLAGTVRVKRRLGSSQGKRK